jgi:hypothetical protein
LCFGSRFLAPPVLPPALFAPELAVRESAEPPPIRFFGVADEAPALAGGQHLKRIVLDRLTEEVVCGGARGLLLNFRAHCTRGGNSTTRLSRRSLSGTFEGAELLKLPLPSSSHFAC